MPAEDDGARLRREMVEMQIKRRGIDDRRVLDAMREVPREEFVPDSARSMAYRDSALPIGEGQTISQPYMVAAMIEAAAVAPGDVVLEVGGGSGYAAAVLSRIAARVISIERHAGLAEAARARLVRLGYDNVETVTGDGSEGWAAGAPYDAIIVAAGAPRVPEALKAQLAPGGRLVLPVGGRGQVQELVLVTRGADGWQQRSIMPVVFVPLIGSAGWHGEN